jgi:hypothetical protein
MTDHAHKARKSRFTVIRRLEIHPSPQADR